MGSVVLLAVADAGAPPHPPACRSKLRPRSASPPCYFHRYSHAFFPPTSFCSRAQRVTGIRAHQSWLPFIFEPPPAFTLTSPHLAAVVAAAVAAPFSCLSCQAQPTNPNNPPRVSERQLPTPIDETQRNQSHSLPPFRIGCCDSDML